jgi:hypothetical protein
VEGARPFFVTARGKRRVDERVGTVSQKEYYNLKLCYCNIFVVKNERKVTKMGRVVPLKTGEFTIGNGHKKGTCFNFLRFHW